MKKKSLIAICLVTVLVLSLVGACAAPAPAPTPAPAPAPAPAPEPVEPVILAFPQRDPPTGFFPENYWMWYASEVEERTDGRVKVEIYWSNTLIPEREVLTGVAAGLADIGQVQATYFPAKFPLTVVLEAPFNVADPWVCLTAAEGLYQASPDVRAEMDAIGVVRLASRTSGSFQYLSGVPVTGLKDMEGKVVRTFGGARQLMWERLDIPTTFLGYSALYEAVQRGVIVGFDGNPILSEQFKHQEVLDTVALHFSGAVAASNIVMNRARWESFPADIQKMFMDLKHDFHLQQAKMLVTTETATINRWRDELGINMVTFSDEDMNRMKEVAVTVAVDMAKKQDELMGTPGAGEFIWQLWQSLVKKYEIELAEKGYPWE